MALLLPSSWRHRASVCFLFRLASIPVVADALESGWNGMQQKTEDELLDA